ncbi:MAG: hypothetical protein AAF228_12070 [Pseudomonadota bacterium]
MKTVDIYVKVRQAYFREGKSKREIARLFGVNRRTVDKMLKHSIPPGYHRRQPVTQPKLVPFKEIIDEILSTDKSRPKKQRHTAQRIFERLKDEHGFTGSYTIVRTYVCDKKFKTKEFFVPLSHAPGRAQVDFGEALAVIGGIERKVHYFAIDLPHSDSCFVSFMVDQLICLSNKYLNAG